MLTFVNMKLTFTTLDGELVSHDLADDMELENVKAICEMDLGVPAASMILSANGRDLVDNKQSLQSVGLKDGDMVLIKSTKPTPSSSRPPGDQTSPNKIPKIDFSSIKVPGSAKGAASASKPAGTSQFSPKELHEARMLAEGTRQRMATDSAGVQEHLAKIPGMFDAVLKNDHEEIARILRRERAEAQRKIQLLYSDPDSHEAQQLIQEQIRRERVQENFEYAVEHAPENLAMVHMLYVKCSVNGIPMKAFVDSGAQISIISREFAEKCHIAHLIDDRFQGMAVGVGSQKFVGKIHACQMEIGGAFLTTSFSVLEANNMQILLGLDMLKRHQMCIDLKKNVLNIGTTNAETPFLHESELPTTAIGQPGGMLFVPNEPDIQALEGMGFSREDARQALIQHEGNKEAAVADLLMKKTGQSSSKPGK